MIPSSAAAVPEEWTIPPRGVYTVVALSATVTLCADDAVARPRARTHAHAHISILIDTKHNSRHKTRVVCGHMKIERLKWTLHSLYKIYRGFHNDRESFRASTYNTRIEVGRKISVPSKELRLILAQ